jgi:hypothetical protein
MLSSFTNNPYAKSPARSVLHILLIITGPGREILNFAADFSYTEFIN